MFSDEERSRLGLAYDARYLHLTRRVESYVRAPNGDFTSVRKEFRVPACGTRMKLTHVDPHMGAPEGPRCPACHELVYGATTKREPKAKPLPPPEQPFLPGCG